MAVDEGGVDQAATAGALALRKGRQNTHRRIDACEDIGDGNAGTLRFAVGGAGQIHNSAHPLGHQIVTGTRGVGPGLTEPGNRTVDQPWVILSQARIAEAEFGQAPDLEILDQYVRACRELLDDPPPVDAVEIKLDRTLAAVGGVEIGGPEMGAVTRRDEWGAPAPGIVARAFSLDLDHVGAEIGENLPSPWSRQNAGEFEHA